jgi:hypothetical protein
MRQLKKIPGNIFRQMILGIHGIYQEDIKDGTTLCRSQISKEIKSNRGANEYHRHEIFVYLKKNKVNISYDDFWCFNITLQKVCL